MIESLLKQMNFTNIGVRSLDRNLVEPALAVIGGEFAARPLSQATLLTTVAAAYNRLGLSDEAVGPARQALEIRHRLLGDDDPQTLASMRALAHLLNRPDTSLEAERYAGDALQRSRRALGENHRETLESLRLVAGLMITLGHLEQAEMYAREAMERSRAALGQDDPDTLVAIAGTAGILVHLGRYEEGERFFREAIAGYQRLYGDDHQATRGAMIGLGMTLWQTGRYAEADEYWGGAPEDLGRHWGDEHPLTINAISNMGLLRKSEGRLAEAEEYFAEAERRVRRTGGTGWTLGLHQTRLGETLAAQGRFEEAEAKLLEAYKSLDGAPERVNQRASIVTSLARSYDGWHAAVPGAGHDVSANLWFSELEAHYREKIDDARHRNGAEHPDTLAAIVHLGVLLRERGRHSEAEPLLREGMQTAERILGPDHKTTLRAMNSLGMLRREQGQLVEAEELSSAVVDRVKRTEGGQLVTRHYMVRHAQNLVALRRFDQAEAQMIEATEIRAPGWEGTTLATCEVIAAIVDHYDACHAAEPGAGHDVKAAAWRAMAGPEGASELQAPAPAAPQLQRGEPATSSRQNEAAPDAPGAPPGADAVLIESLLEQMNFTNIGVRSLDRNIIEPALVAIERDFADQPLIEATLRLSLSRMYRRLGDDREAAALTARALELRQRHLGEDHLETLEALAGLASLHKTLGAYAESERCAREVLEKRRLLLGEDDRRTIIAAEWLASILVVRGKWTEAEALNRASVERHRRILGDDHLSTLESITGRGVMLGHAGRFAEAEACFLEAIEGRRRQLGDDHPNTLNSINALCGVLWRTDRLEEAEPYLRLLVEGRRRSNGDDHPWTLGHVRRLGMLLREQGRLEEAEPYLFAAMEGLRRSCGPNDSRTLDAMTSMVLLRREQGRPEEGEQIAAEVLRRVRGLGAQPRKIRHYLVRHAQMLIALGRVDEAEAAMLEVEAMSEPNWPETQLALNETLEALARHYDTLHAADPHAGHDARATHWRAGVVEKHSLREAVAGQAVAGR